MIIQQKLKFSLKWSSFEKVAFLGHGSFGPVYHYKSEKDHLNVAVKVFRLEKNKPKYESFQRELDFLFKLHKKIPNRQYFPIFYGFLEYSEPNEPNFANFMLLFELATGNLKTLVLSKGKGLSYHKTLILFNTLLRGLAILKNLGVAHQNLKPENVLYFEQTDKIYFKLSDFGEIKLDDNGVLRGNQAFLAPEINFAYLNGGTLVMKKNDPYKWDIYSLGLLLLFVNIRKSPFQKDLEHLNIRLKKDFNDKSPDFIEENKDLIGKEEDLKVTRWKEKSSDPNRNEEGPYDKEIHRIINEFCEKYSYKPGIKELKMILKSCLEYRPQKREGLRILMRKFKKFEEKNNDFFNLKQRMKKLEKIVREKEKRLRDVSRQNEELMMEVMKKKKLEKVSIEEEAIDMVVISSQEKKEDLLINEEKCIEDIAEKFIKENIGDNQGDYMNNSKTFYENNDNFKKNSKNRKFIEKQVEKLRQNNKNQGLIEKNPDKTLEKSKEEVIIYGKTPKVFNNSFEKPKKNLFVENLEHLFEENKKTLENHINISLNDKEKHFIGKSPEKPIEIKASNQFPEKKPPFKQNHYDLIRDLNVNEKNQEMTLKNPEKPLKNPENSSKNKKKNCRKKQKKHQEILNKFHNTRKNIFVEKQAKFQEIKNYLPPNEFEPSWEIPSEIKDTNKIRKNLNIPIINNKTSEILSKNPFAHNKIPDFSDKIIGSNPKTLRNSEPIEIPEDEPIIFKRTPSSFEKRSITGQINEMLMKDPKTNEINAFSRIKELISPKENEKPEKLNSFDTFSNSMVLKNLISNSKKDEEKRQINVQISEAAQNERIFQKALEREEKILKQQALFMEKTENLMNTEEKTHEKPIGIDLIRENTRKIQENRPKSPKKIPEKSPHKIENSYEDIQERVNIPEKSRSHEKPENLNKKHDKTAKSTISQDNKQRVLITNQEKRDFSNTKPSNFPIEELKSTNTNIEVETNISESMISYSKVSCNYCSRNFPLENLIILSCDHRFCLDCISENMERILKRVNSLIFLFCIKESCRTTCEISIIKKKLSKSLRESFEKSVVGYYKMMEHLKLNIKNDFPVCLTFIHKESFNSNKVIRCNSSKCMNKQTHFCYYCREILTKATLNNHFPKETCEKLIKIRDFAEKKLDFCLFCKSSLKFNHYLIVIQGIDCFLICKMGGLRVFCMFCSTILASFKSLIPHILASHGSFFIEKLDINNQEVYLRSYYQGNSNIIDIENENVATKGLFYCNQCNKEINEHKILRLQDEIVVVCGERVQRKLKCLICKVDIDFDNMGFHERNFHYTKKEKEG